MLLNSDENAIYKSDITYSPIATVLFNREIFWYRIPRCAIYTSFEGLLTGLTIFIVISSPVANRPSPIECLKKIVQSFNNCNNNIINCPLLPWQQCN